MCYVLRATQHTVFSTFFMIKFAILSFPGNNCETETVRAFKRNGMEAQIVLWNDPALLNGSRCLEFDGYCLVGGFSYEDRGRSGMVAAQDPVMQVIAREADMGKVVLGICNGAQALVETGMIPGFDQHALAIALAWNEMRVGNEIVATGFYNSWCHLKNEAPKGRSAFNDFEELLHVPFAHGEGRFMMDPSTLEKLEANHQILFKYCDEKGIVSPDFPITPNGATAAAAAICNPAGNVMAIMPHPERDPRGNGNPIFQSIKKWIETKKKTDYQSLGSYASQEDIRPLPSLDIEVLVKLIITDNTERTLEETFIRKGFPISLERYDYYGVTLSGNTSVDEAIQKIMATGELANFNKHLVFIKTKEGFFTYDPHHGLRPREMKLEHCLIAVDQKDFVGQSKMTAINLHAGRLITSLQYGSLWNVVGADENLMERVIASKILYNPNSMYLMKP